jgi:putative ATP-binding cassette transporter
MVALSHKGLRMQVVSKFDLVRSTAHKIWALTVPYFRSEERWKARGLLLAIVLLNLGAVYMLVQITNWNRVFYDALEKRDQAVFWVQLLRFTYLALGYIIIAVYKFYLTQLLEVRWRAWMTTHYLERWLSSKAFYRMELARFSTGSGSPDNPDQRIQEDLNLFTGYTVSLTMGLLNAVVTLASFVGILWGLSGGFNFSMGGATYEIPGFMVWAAVVYCAAGSLITHFIGRRQIPLNFQQQRYEADFRHHMVRVREYSEAIALDKGEQVERRHLDLRFSRVLANYLQLIRAQKNLIWFSSFFGQAASEL